MTLVIAKQKGDIIAAVSDTGVMQHGVRLGPTEQVPKICIPTSHLAIGFAGSPDLAKRYLEEFSRQERTTFRATVDYFEERHKEGGVDFLLLFNRPVPKIIPIRDGKVQSQTKHAWIGDKAGLEAFPAVRKRGTKCGHSPDFRGPAARDCPRVRGAAKKSELPHRWHASLCHHRP